MAKTPREEKLASFNPDFNGLEAKGLFGLPFTPAESTVVVVPVPWEVTVSYGAGTAHAPAAILEASQQIDLHDFHFGKAWQHGFAMDAIQPLWEQRNAELRLLAEPYIKTLESGKMQTSASDFSLELEKINEGCSEMVDDVEDVTRQWLSKGKLVGIAGGDHSSPLGLMRTLAIQHPGYSVLQLDAHADLRPAYEGFEFSHASIMHNALKISAIENLVQVGIRDISQGESDVIKKAEGRIKVFYDAAQKEQLFRGKSWAYCCDEIVESLEKKVYISFDIDALEPHLCPNTGTPVPGGLSFEQAVFLLETLVKSGRQIIGFDLCEVSPGQNEWDANVGARMLYKLCGFAATALKA
ncbi:MAG: agmatinase family protein [Bacteroidia bacterium]